MANPYRIEARGNMLLVRFDDGSTRIAAAIPGRAWMLGPGGSGPDPDPDPDPGTDPTTFDMVSNDGALSFTIQAQGMKYARIVYDEGVKLGLDRDGITAAFMCVMVEAPPFLMYANSNVPDSLNYPHDAVGSDNESLGLFQQQTVWGWGSTAELMDAGHNARAFFGGPTGPNFPSPPGLLDLSPPWDQQATLGTAVQNVQGSAYPTRYDNWTTACYALFDAMGTGGGGSGSWEWPAQPIPYTEGGDMPAPGSQDAIWAEYGPRSGIGVGGFHEGMDFGYGTMLNGADIRCAGDGVVFDAALSGGYGNRIRVDHPDGTSTSYCHIQNGGMLVGPGAQVTAGQHIGVVGGTGGVAPHLHFETHETTAAAQVPNTANNGGHRSAVNPRDYMAARV